MSTQLNQMENNLLTTSLNQGFVSTSHDQFIPKRMKKANLFVKTLGVLALILATASGTLAQCSITFPSNSGSVPAQGSTIYFTDCDGNGSEQVSWTAPTASSTGSCGSVSVNQGGGPSNGSSISPGNYVVNYTAQAVDVSNFSIVTVSYSFNVVVQSANPTAGGLTNAQTICSGTDPSTIASAVDGTQGSGNGIASSITYQWQYSIDNVNWTDISGATTSTYDPSALTTTTYYRRRTVVNFANAACPNGIVSAYTPSITITVINNPTAGSINATQGYCGLPFDPIAFNNVISGTGTGAPLSYQWYTSTSPSSGFSAISGATNSTYDEPSLSSVTNNYFQRKTILTLPSGELCYSAATNTLLIGDTTDPVLTCASNQTVSPTNANCEYVVSSTALDVAASDACPVTSTYALTGVTTGTGSSLNGVSFNPGVTTVTWTSVDAHGNSASCSFTVSVIKASVSNQTASVCSENTISVILGSSATSTAVTDYNYVSETSTGLSFSAGTALSVGSNPYTSTAIQSHEWTNSGNSTANVVYTFTPVDAVGCEGDDFTVTVAIKPIPASNAGSNDAICDGQTYILSGAISGGATAGTWTTSGSGTFSSATALNAVYTPSAADITGGTVTLTLTTNDPFSCGAASDDMVLTINSLPDVSAGSDQIVCNGSNVTFTASSSNISTPTFSWNNGISQATAFAAVNNTTNYDTTLYVVTATDVSTSCTNTDTVQLVVVPTPTVDQQTDITYCGGVEQLPIVFTGSTSNTQYLWESTANVGFFFGPDIANPNLGGNYNIDPSSQVIATVTVTPQIVVNGQLTCDGLDMTFDVTVNPTPTIDGISDQTVCNGSSTTALAFTGNQGNSATYNWTNSNTSIGLSSATGSGDISSFTAVNNGTTAQTANIVVTPVLGSCSGSTMTTSITVNPTPTVTDPSDQTLCAGSTTNQVNFTGAVSGTLYSWSYNGDAIGIPSSGYGTVPAFVATNSGNSALSGTVTVTPEFIPTAGTSFASVSEGQAFSLTAPQGMIFTSVTFASYGNPTGTGPNYTQGSEHVVNTVPIIEQAALGNNSFTITANDANFPNNFSAISSLAVVLTYGDPNTACTGTAQTYTYTVNPVPVYGDQSEVVCSGTGVNVTPTGSNVPTGTQFTWTYTDNSNVTGEADNSIAANNFSATLTNTSNIQQSVVYTVTPATSTCAGSAFALTVNVDPTPVVATQYDTICSGNSFTVAPSNGSGNIVPAGTTYSWSAPTVTGITGTASGTDAANISGTLVNTTNAPIDVTYTVTPTYNYNGPTVGSNYGGGIVAYILQASDPGYVAGMTTALIVAPSDQSTGVPWYIDNIAVNSSSASGVGTGLSNTNSIISTLTGLGANPNVYAAGIARNYTGGGFSDWFLPSLTEWQKIYQNVGPNASAPNTNVAILNGANTGYWSSTRWSTTRSYTPLANNLNDYSGNGWTGGYVRAARIASYIVTPATCPGSPFNVTVTVNPTPVIANTTTTICSEGTFTVTPTNGSDIVPSGTTYTWAAPSVAGITGSVAGSGASSISGTLTNTTNAPIDVTYTVTPIAGSCTGSTFTVTVTVFPTPALSSTLTPAAICSEATFSYTATSNTVAATGSTVMTWTRAAVTGITETASSGNGDISEVLTNTTNAPIDVTYVYTITSNGCSATNDVVVTVNPTPTVDAITSQILCNSDASTAITFASTFNVTGTTYSWTNSNTSTGLSQSSGTGDIASFTATNNTNTPILSTIIVTPTANGCDGLDETFTIRVNPTPTVDPIQGQTVCNGATVQATQFTSAFNVAGTSYDWVSDNTSIGISASGTGDIASFTAVNNTNAPVTATITVTPSATFGGSTLLQGSSLTGSETVGTIYEVNVTGSINGSIWGTGIYTYDSDIATAAVHNGNLQDGISGTVYIEIIPVINNHVASTANGVTSMSYGAWGNISYQFVPQPQSTPSSCTGSVETFTITVNPTPTVDAITSQVVCENTSTAAVAFTSTFNVSGTTYDWTNDNTSIDNSSTLTSTGSGDISSFTAINSTDAVETATIVVTPSANGCSGSTESFTIDVNPRPDMADQASEICSGSTMSIDESVVGDIVPNGTQYTWTVSNANVTGESSQATASSAPSQQLTNTVSNITDVTYVITPSYTGQSVTCTGSPFNAVVSVSPEILVGNETVDVCSGASFLVTPLDSVNGNEVPTGIDYSWSAPSSTSLSGEASGNYESNITGTLFNLTTATVDVTYQVTPSFDMPSGQTCYGSDFNVTVSVLTGAPTVNVNASLNSICSNDSVQVTATTIESLFGTWSTSGDGNFTPNVTNETINYHPSPSDVSNGSATLYFTATNACGTTTDSVTISLISIPSVAVIGGGSSVCNGSTLSLSNSTSGGVWGTSNSAIASVDASGVVTGNAVGTSVITYSVTSGGCTNTESTTVIVSSLPSATITASTTTICTGASVTLSANAGSGNTYSWSNGTSVVGTTQSIVVSPTATTSYTVTVTLSTGCSTTSSATTVTVNSLPTATITASAASVCAGSSATLTASSGTSYLWSTGATTASITVSPTSATSYSVTVTNANGCSATSAVTTIAVDALPTVAAITGTTNVCSGLTTQLASATAGGTWSSSDPLVATVSSTGVVTGVSAGTATITYSVTNSNGCSNAVSATINVNAGSTATITAGGATTFCQGGSVTLTASTGASYLWSNGAQTQSITVTAGGSYYVTVTNASGCSATSAATTVTVDALPTVAAITGATNICSGLTTQLASATAGGTWSSSDPLVATVSSTGVVTGVSAGTATITYSVTNSNGCSNAVSATINVNAGSTATITAGGATTFCQGGSVTLTASTGASYLWSNGAQTQSITVTAGGSYYVTVTNASGCSATSAATSVTVNPLPTANILANGPLTFCQGGSVTLSASPIVAGNTYLWSNGATTSSINVTASATITVTVTSAAGCSTTSLPTSVNVFTNPTATITATGSTTFCQGGSVVLTANAGTGYSYQWSNNTNNQTVTVSTAGSYTVTVTDANGCSVTSAPTVVTVNPLPTTAAITGTSSVCIGGTTLLSTTATNPVWSSANTAVATVAANGLVTGVSAGTAVVSYTITNANGCTNTASVTVTVNQLPTAAIATVGATTFCQGGTVTLIASNAPAGMTYSYQWNLNGTTITGANANTYVANTSGSYSVTITTNSGCAATSAATTITVNPLPVLAANTGATSVCENGTVTLANAQAGGLWSTANNTVATINAVTGVVTGINPGTTTLTYTFTNANGCTNSVSTNFTVNALPAAVITANGPTAFCQGGSVTLTANAGSSYLWSTGATTQSITVNNTQDVTVTVTNANGCSATSAVTSIVVNANPVANITSLNGNTFCQGGSVTLVSSPGASYAWSNGAFTQSITVTSTSTLTVTVTNADGCSATSAPFTVTMNAAPVATVTANGPTTFCAGGSVVLSAPAAASYLWSSGETTQTIVASVDGPYTVTVTDGNGCSATSANMNITVLALPTVQAIAGSNALCVGSTTTLTNTTIGGVWSSNNTSVATIAANGEVTGVSAGTATMTYTVTNANGCSNAVSFTINVNAATVLTPIAGTATVCEGATTTLANAQVGGTWSSSDVAIATVAANGVVTGISAGSATISYTYTNASGCTSSVSQALVVNALPAAIVSASGSTTFCAGGSVILTAPAGMTYAWSTGEPTQSITISTTGNYSVTITNANGCSSTSAPVAVTVNALPSVSIANIGATTFCAGGSVTLISPLNSTYAYAWNNGANAITGASNNTYVASSTGSYSLTITDANGCTATSAAIPVTVNAVPVVTAAANGPTTFCAGGSVTLTASGAATYVWSTGATSPSITVNASDVVTVVGTTVDGCSSTSNAITVTVNALPVATITSSGSTACLGSTVTLTANGGATYSWSNNATTPSINVTAANTYTVTVTSAAGCTSTASETVVFNANPAVTVAANGPTVFCQGGSLTLTATGGSNYVWSNGDQGASTTVTQSGSYFVTVTNAAGCTTQSSIVNVTVNAVPVVASINGANSVCEGGNMTLTSATPGGVWTSANNFIATIDGAGNVTGLNAGSTTITYTVSVNGCTASAVAQINILNNPVTPTITASGATSVCPGGSVVLFASNAANYQWSNGPQTPFIVATQSGAYTVTATGLNGCSATSLPVNVFIGDNTAPVITAPLNVTVTPNLGCEAIGVTLGTPVTSDNCSVASVTNDAPAIFPIGTTTVTWTVTDGSGNVTTATQLVTVVDQTAPTAFAPANVTVSSNNFCEATGVDLGMPIATDNCTNNLTITNNAPATYPLGTTTVTWTITDAAGNVTTVDQTVTVVDETAPVVLLANTSVILDANGYAAVGFEDLNNGSYDNCGIASVVISQSEFDCSNVGNNLVSVTITDNNGNQSSAQVMITVIASDACGGSNWAGPSVPDAFTPNGNNFNDTWVIPGLEGYNTKEMTVYSRYGTLVHYSGQYNNDWDGTLLNTGTPVPDGTYYYILNLDGGKQLNGYVYINRVKQ